MEHKMSLSTSPFKMTAIRKILNKNSAYLTLGNNSKKIEKTLQILALCSWLVLIIAQIIMALLFSGEQISDSAIYLSLAKKALEANTIYPSYLNSHDSFTFGNGYVNLLILIFRFTENLKVAYFINIIATQLLLFCSAYVLHKITKQKIIVCWYIIFFSLLTTFWSEAVQLRTEIIFTSIAFSAVAIAYSKMKFKYISVGIVLALANWVRPLGLAFLFGLTIKLFCDNEKIKSYIKLFSGYFITIVLIGAVTFSQCGVFIYQSTTFGYNLLMSANDNADGSYMNVHTEGNVGYIPPEQKENFSFNDFDEYYVELSVKWLKENPEKYIKQIPTKIFYLFATETYSGSAFFNNTVSTSGIDYIKSLVNKVQGNGTWQIGDILIIFAQGWYMLIFALFIIGIFIAIKKKSIIRFAPLLLTFLCGTGITILVVGSARYHFPYLPIFMMGAAVSAQAILGRISNKPLSKNIQK